MAIFIHVSFRLEVYVTLPIAFKRFKYTYVEGLQNVGSIWEYAH